MCRMCQRRGGFLSLFSFFRGAGKEIENPYFFLFFFLFSKREGNEERGFEIFFFISFSLPPRKKKEEENEEKIYFLIVFSFIPFIWERAWREIGFSICFLSSFFFARKRRQKLKRILFLFGEKGKEEEGFFCQWKWAGRKWKNKTEDGALENRKNP